MSFSFGFAGDDIADDENTNNSNSNIGQATATQPDAAPTASAFPVPGKPQLPPTHHDLAGLLDRLPSKIAYDLMPVQLDDGSVIQLPRRELWDVRVQLMAEEGEGEGEGEGSMAQEGLGTHDVKTGVYEGGFKSWESSVDLVKVLAANGYAAALSGKPVRVIELGCGTALPSLALFQWFMSKSGQRQPLSLVLADYNPSVLQLVTLPNFILAWALQNRDSPALADAFSIEGEVELGPEVLATFQQCLLDSAITLSFVSGGWSLEFVDLLYSVSPQRQPNGCCWLLGAETIYSPFALQAFSETLFAILSRERDSPGSEAAALVAAKRLYFGVGGSLDDFIDRVRARGAAVEQLREETEGVRRGVVQCLLGQT